MNTFAIACLVASTLFLALALGARRQAKERLARARLVESDEVYLLRKIGLAVANWAEVKGAADLTRTSLNLRKVGLQSAALLGSRRAAVRLPPRGS